MKKDVNTLTQTEVINFAICYLGEKCRKYAEDIEAMKQKDPAFAEKVADAYGVWFWKLRKLLELYEIQTGQQYDLEFDFLN